MRQRFSSNTSLKYCFGVLENEMYVQMCMCTHTDYSSLHRKHKNVHKLLEIIEYHKVAEYQIYTQVSCSSKTSRKQIKEIKLLE